MTRDEFEAVLWRELSPLRESGGTVLPVVDAILEAADEYLASAGWDTTVMDPHAEQHRDTLDQALSRRRR